MMEQLSFGAMNFGQINIGDARRTKRLVESVDAMARHPGGTLPDKLNRPSELRAFYRLMNCKRVTHDIVMQSHTDATRQKMREIAANASGSTFLILHDATELDYTSLLSLKDALSHIGPGSNLGYICHNSLVVQCEPQQLIGLSSQILHNRAYVPKKETDKQRRQRRNRESRLWAQGARACGAAPPNSLCVDVSDSLSDTFEYMAYEISNGRHFLLRAREDRKLAEPVGEHMHLYGAVRAQPAVGTAEVKICANTNQIARTANVQFSHLRVLLAPPRKRSGEYASKPLEIWVVRVWEPDPPKGVDPLEWILHTNVEVNNVSDATCRVEWYKCRPIVEEYHKGMKTGCGIEDMQFTTVDAMKPAIAVISVVATTLLKLRDLARHPESATRPATSVVDAEYVEALVAYYPKRLAANPTIRDFFLHVARLGGHQNRKCDGMPGWLTLWRGWMKLEQLAAGHRLGKAAALRRCGKT